MFIKLRSITYYSALVMILGASCSSPKPEPHAAPEFYDLSVYEEAKVSDILEVAEVVPLLFERDTYPKFVNRLSHLDGNILIGEIDKSVHVFSSDGHYIGCSQSMKGEGPGEHAMQLNHIVNPFNHTVDVLGITKMYSYDAEFTHCERESAIPNLVGQVDVGLLYDDGIALSGGLYLLHSRLATDPYKVSLYNSSAGTTIKQWDYTEDIIAFFTGSFQKFFKMPDGEILMKPQGYSPYIYGFGRDGSDMYKAIEFKYNSKTISDRVTIKDVEANPKIIDNYLGNASYEIPLKQLLNSKKIITLIQTGPDKFKDHYYLIADRESGKVQKADLMEDGKVTIIPLLYMMDEEFVYNVLSKEKILEFSGCLLNKASEADSLLRNHDEDDFFLIKYRFKK